MASEIQDEKAIFNLAREIVSPDARAEYLRQACGADSALRERVQVLLRAYEEQASFLESPPPVGASHTIDQPASESPGAVIGPYKLIEHIGEGGMGTVWMAQQTEPVKRVVALKLIKAGMDSKQIIARFEAERQALALMDHPNIAKVLDGGTTSEGRPYFVMDLVKGVSITKYCDDHHLTPRQRLELFIPVCQAVQHAHQKGIIHRDLKPSNVLVALYDGKPVPKVIDFGVAKAAGQSLTEQTLVTGLGNIVGTLEYMSPEQAELNQLDIDTRSDIYSLGVLLYELLTGSPPFSRKELEKAGMLEMLRVIREQEPSKPSTKLSTAEGLPTLAANRGTEPAKLTKLVRGELDWIVMKALEKDRNHRYETANGFAMDVQRYLADEPVLACPPSAWYHFRKFARRNRAALVAASGVLLVVLLAVVGLATSSTLIANALQAEIKAKDELKGALAGERAAAYRYAIALAERYWLGDQVKEARRVLAECDPELRHWEWHYLKRLFEGGLLNLEGHSRLVVSVAFSSDGQRVASVSRDSDAALGGINGKVGVPSELKIWDTGNGRQLFSRIMPLVDVVGFRSDGTLLALAFEANEIVVWDGATGKELRRLQGHTGRVQCAAVSPDGRWLASAGWDQTVKVWDLADGRELHNLRGHRRSVDCLSFSRDGRLLASASRGAAPPVLRGEVKVWDLQAGKEKFGMGGQPSHFTGVAISPDGLELATASGDGIVRIWDIETRKESRSFSGNGQRVQVMAWNSAAHRVAFMVMDETGNEILRERGVMPRIAVARDDGIVRMLDTATGEEVFTLRGHIAPVQNLAFSRDGTRLASGGWDRTVRLWNATAGPEALALREEAKRSREHRPPPERYIGPRWLAFGSNGKELAAVCGVGTARLYDSRTGSVSATWNEEAHNLGDVAFSADGRLVAAALVPSEWDGPPGQRRDYPVKIWDRASGKEILTLHVQAHRVAFSPNGTLLATTHRGSIGVWDTQTGLQIFGVQTLTAGATCIAFTPDGRHLAGATSAPGFVRDGEPGATTHDLEIWDVTTRERVFHRSCQASVARLAFHPDGKRLACVGSGPGIVWNTSTGEHACTLSGHSDAMTDVLFSGDGRRVFTASDDRTVKVWDTDSGKELLTLRGHHQAVVGLALSPEDDSLASAGEDGIVRIWATASRP